MGIYFKKRKTDTWVAKLGDGHVGIYQMLNGRYVISFWDTDENTIKKFIKRDDKFIGKDFEHLNDCKDYARELLGRKKRRTTSKKRN